MRLLISLTAAALLTTPLRSQTCPGFAEGFGCPGADARVSCSTIHDDGTGPALYVGGQFHSVGSVLAMGIARWDGTAWSAVGRGLGPAFGSKPDIRALASLNGRLYAGGDFGEAGGPAGTHLAVWDGANWSAVPGEPNGIVDALATDQGTLLVGGAFSGVGGLQYGNYFARFDPASSSWSSFGTGFWTAQVFSIATYPTASGTHVFVGGDFIGIPSGASSIVEWDGSSWSIPGGGLVGISGTPRVFAMRALDDGTGPKLFVCGRFIQAGGITANGIATWNGSAWSSVGSGVVVPYGGGVYALQVHDDGTGQALYVAGLFGSNGGTQSPNVTRYRNGAFEVLPATPDRAVLTLASFQGRLFAGGDHVHAGHLHTEHLTTWQNGAWQRAADGSGLGVSPSSFATYDDGSGQELYSALGGALWAGLVRRRSGSWERVAIPAGAQPTELVAGDVGSGSSLFVFGNFRDAQGTLHPNVMSWRQGSWTNLTPGHVSNGITSMLVFDDGNGPQLFVCGYFTSIDGVMANRVARWNGVSWSAAGAGFSTNVDVLHVHDDGNGPALFAGGGFPGKVSRWDGTSWTSLGGSMGEVYALASMDEAGPELIVGGAAASFSSTSPSLMRWQNGTWSVVGNGLGLGGVGFVRALATFDDGTGEALYVTGQFSQADGMPVSSIARWNGHVWNDVGGGLGNPISNFAATPPLVGQLLHVHDEFRGRSLWVTGDFGSMGGVVSARIARLEPCTSPGEVSCSGDGSGSQCPCGNDSGSGQGAGCLNSLGSGGRLSATGSARLSQDTLVLHGSQMPDGAVLYFQGTQLLAGGSGVVFGDGVLCVGGRLVRLGATTNVAGGSQWPPVSGTPMHEQGQVHAPGLRHYQAWYHDVAPFCAPSTYNTTNDLTITWTL